MLYFLFEEKINEITDETFLVDKLYKKLTIKGFNSIKEYLYELFISNKGKYFETNYWKEINKVVGNSKEFFDIPKSLQTCKFIAFSMYLVKEIFDYVNLFKSTSEKMKKTSSLLDNVNNIINKYYQDYCDDETEKENLM